MANQQLKWRTGDVLFERPGGARDSGAKDCARQEDLHSSSEPPLLLIQKVSSI